jgi:CubicO group peptidase (beta-lactamase class C family)
MDEDATWWVDTPHGNGLAGSGLAATLRDYGRFALLAANGGQIDGRAIVPTGWFDEAGAAHTIGGKHVGYGYMWWVASQDNPIHAGAFEANGIFGQLMYINPREHLVIVVLSARSKPSETSTMQLDDDAFFAAVALALRS